MYANQQQLYEQQQSILVSLALSMARMTGGLEPAFLAMQQSFQHQPYTVLPPFQHPPYPAKHNQGVSQRCQSQQSNHQERQQDDADDEEDVSEEVYKDFKEGF